VIKKWHNIEADTLCFLKCVRERAVSLLYFIGTGKKSLEMIKQRKTKGRDKTTAEKHIVPSEWKL